MRPVSEKKRSNVISSLQQGLSVRQVAGRCGVSKSVVQKIRVQYCPDIPALSPGRPAKLSSQDKRCCIRAVTSGRHQTAVAVAKMLKEELHIEASPMTIRRAFREGGLGSIEKKPKPMLSAKNIKARLDFANLHRDWTVEDWKHVIWSDETKINRFCSDGRAWAWISDGQKLQPHHVKQTVKHGGGSLMVWGCMAAQGPGFMCRI